jgi:NAD(P)-dependent dehydrogenase (short-subunit alcohol dehydrogenase family)
VAIVTGSSRGIGRAIAVALAEAGYDVTVNYRSDHKSAEETTELIARQGRRFHLVRADVALESDREKLVEETISRLGAIALLVNNAGISVAQRQDMLELPVDAFGSVMSTNLVGPLYLTQRVARHMIQMRPDYPAGVTPAIINVGSISGYAVSVDRAEYCLAKAALTMLTHLFAVRLAEHDIRVHEVRPGIIATDMTRAAREKYDRLIQEENFLPLARWGQPQDVAQAVVALARGALPYATGTVVDIDGGFHLRRL